MIRTPISTARFSCKVPAIDPAEQERFRDQIFQKYYSSTMKRSGKGTAVVWFRNDLRVIDNEALQRAWASSESILPVYCVDPRLFHETQYFGFPKTGALRAQFLKECVEDLKRHLMMRGLDLLIKHGKPEEILPSLVREFAAHKIFAQKETCIEEVAVENSLRKALEQAKQPGNPSPQLHLLWGSTLFHKDDLPFSPRDVPDVFTQFRKAVEARSSIRNCIKLPSSLAPTPRVEDWGQFPSLETLEIHPPNVAKGMSFIGGESAGLGRIHEYFWKKDLLKVYKETRNGMLGADYSTKFSPWLASGSISPRLIYEQVKQYENSKGANDSTYWVIFELLWRDYFRFISIKYGNSIFHLGGPRKVERKWNKNTKLLEQWKSGSTGYPLIDANMKELSTTGFMSNRGRQIVCSFLVRDMGVDWRMGAEWFESCLLDYDPCSNYGNWTYGAGVGNDPREDRYFSVPKQAKTYDPEGEYVAFWLPELESLPKDKRHVPGRAYIQPLVPLKFPTFHKDKQTTPEFRRNGSKYRR